MFIDHAIPVDVKVDRNKTKRITAAEYERLNDEARRYVTGSGNTAAEHRIVHTTAGYISIVKEQNNSAYASWISDEFTVKAVVVDRDGNFFADIAAGERVLRFPFESLLPARIVPSFFAKGIAVSKVDRAHEALALHVVQPEGAEITYLAGLYRFEEHRGVQIPVFAVLTRESVAPVSIIHNRMPVILGRENLREWIRPDGDPGSVTSKALTNMVIEKAKDYPEPVQDFTHI